MIFALLYWAITRQLWAVPAAVVAGIVLALLVRAYRQLTDQWMRASTLAAINRNGAARIRRDWPEIPEAAGSEFASTHPYANDLDIAGHASLLQLLDTTATRMGGARLEAWLVDPAPVEEIDERQDAIRELSSDLEWLQELQQETLLGEGDDAETDKFLAWARGEQSAGPLPAATWLARLTNLLTIAILALSIGGVIDSYALTIPFAINLVLMFVYAGRMNPSIDAALTHGKAIRSYSETLRVLTSKPHQAALLQHIDAPLNIEGVSAAEATDRLAKILSWGVPTGSLGSYIVQAVTSWNIHFYDQLEKWRNTYGDDVPQWLDAIASYEALGALANLAHDNPEWAYPQVDDDLDTVLATELGHPLIAETRRVCNDVQVGPPGTFLFVTGSNMSGKSTLLRSIGINVVLANAGAPVCAGSMSLPPLSVWTSVRIVDSLESGVSYYMAELLRLKQIVEATHTVTP
ncbi:MAG: hypothetical protein KC438_11940, partial [Thermomicrobiales bacterium]|nr:hypothetical protein [Thermomicrobiales bacterium]